jgi:DNA-binding NtrC family response regulator
MNRQENILVIDDDPRQCESIGWLLEPEFKVHAACSVADGLDKIERIKPQMVLLDLHMPQMGGLGMLEQMREQGRDIPVIIITAYGTVESAVRGIRLGAADIIPKPFDPERLKGTVRRLLITKEPPSGLRGHLGIIGESDALQATWSLVEQYAPADLPVLITGETGTGKESFARAIHQLSRRAHQPFVVVDCASLPETLLESELFGYEQGAFTGAGKAKPGMLEWANSGTLFLDEIGNLPQSYQAKLLRVLQSGAYTPLGGRHSKTLDIRVVCATNADLPATVRQGNFRQDLYYRISGATITLPPLRNRTGDILRLAEYFISRSAKRNGRTEPRLSQGALKCLLAHEWPGNIRELEHVIERAVILAPCIIAPPHLNLEITSERRETLPESGNNITLSVSHRCPLDHPLDLKRIREEIGVIAERQLIEQVRQRYSFNQGELARFLNLDPKTLRSICRRCPS